MKKVLLGILAVFMSLSLAYGSGSLIQKYVLPSQSQTEDNPEKEEIEINASGNWKDNIGNSWSGSATNGTITMYVYSAEELARLARNVNENYYTEDNRGQKIYWNSSNVVVNIQRDIDLSAHYWTPIGCEDRDYSRPFRGKFNGNGYTISGVYINAYRGSLPYNCVNDFFGSDKYCGRYFGLFGYVVGAEIKNFSVNGDFNFYGDTSATWECIANTYVGAVVGYASNTTISNVKNKELDIYNIRKDREFCIFSEVQYVGGIVGYLSGGSMNNCTNENGYVQYTVNKGAEKNDKVDYNLGGIVGGGSGTISNCYFNSYIGFSGPNGSSAENMNSLYMGKIAGNYSGNIKNCFAFGKLTNSGSFDIKGNGYVGGIVAYSSYGLSNCFNYGLISLSEVVKIKAGGIVGELGSGTIESCGNFGDLTFTASRGASNDRGYGGILGYSGESGSKIIQDCANYGNVSMSANSKYTGGIVGQIRNNGTLNRCVNYGKISGGNCTGGIAGEMGADGNKTNVTIKNCINFSESVSGSSSYGKIVGYMNGTDIQKSYYNSSGGGSGIGGGNTGSSGNIQRKTSAQLHNFDFLRSSSNWSSGFNSEISSNNSYSPTNYDKWFLSPLPVQYLSSVSGKGMQSYALIPMAAVGAADVKIFWNKNSGSYTQVDSLSLNFSSEYWGVDTNNNKADWIKSSTFYYLIGANHYTSDDFVRFNPSENFTLNKIEKENNGIIETVSSTTKNGYIHINFQNIPNIGSSVPICNMKVYLNAKNVATSSIQYFISGRKANSRKLRDEEIDSVGKIELTASSWYFDSDITVKATPKIGYVYLGLFAKNEETNSTIVAENQINDAMNIDNFVSGAIYSSPVKSNGYGNVSYNYKHKYAKTILALFGEVDYNLHIKKQWETGFTDLKFGKHIQQLQSEDNAKLDTTYNLILNENYGYEYNFYVCFDKNDANVSENTNLGNDKSKYMQIKGTQNNYVNFRNKSVAFNFDDVVGENCAMNRNYTNEFYIVVTRQKIKYEIVLKNMVNGYEKDIYESSTNVENGAGGYSCFTEYINSNSEKIEPTNGTILQNVTIGEKFSFKNTSFTFYRAVNSYYVIEDSGGKPANGNRIIKNPPQNFENKEKQDFKEIDFTSFLNAYIDENSGKLTDNTINIYSYYCLQQYDFKGSLKINDKTYSANETLPIQVTVKIGQKNADGSIDEKPNSENIYTFSGYKDDDGKEEKKIYYFAPLIITAPNKPGYKFIGFYDVNKDSDGNEKCYSTNSIYKFYHVGQEKTPINIVARYVTYNSSSGSGVVPDKGIYTISTKEDLIWLSEQVENGNTFEGKIINLKNDIDMSGVKFNPIGSEGNPFKGVFNGNNCVISNLKMEENNLSYKGLFGYVDGATIKNLTLRDSTILGYSYVGALAGYAKDSTIENIQNHSATVSWNSIRYYDIYGELTNEDGTIKIGKDQFGNEYLPRNYFGGLIGYSENSKLIGLANKTVIGSSSESNEYSNINYVGGLVGMISGGSISQSFNEGFVNVPYESSNCHYIAFGLSKDNARDCYYRNGNEKPTVYYATKVDGNVSTDYGKHDNSNSDLDTSIWIVVNGKLTLRYFYWN